MYKEQKQGQKQASSEALPGVNLSSEAFDELKGCLTRVLNDPNNLVLSRFLQSVALEVIGPPKVVGQGVNYEIPASSLYYLEGRRALAVSLLSLGNPPLEVR